MGNFTGFQKSEDYYIHPKLGQIKRIQNEDGPQLIQHKVLVESEASFEQWAHLVQKLSNSPCQNIIFLPKSHFFQKIGYCGHLGEVFLLFDDYMFSLKDQIKNRRLIKRSFPESSVWEILYKLIKAECFLKNHNLIIGNVTPQNIFVNQQGDIRILSQHSYPGTDQIVLDLNQQKKKLYSPEEWGQIIKINFLTKQAEMINPIEQKKIQSMIEEHQNDRNVSEMFSIGMSVLQICSLQQSQQIYENQKINQSLLLSRISSLNKKYSNCLINVLWEMLKMSPQQRIKAEELNNMLTGHEAEILGHKKFILANRFNQQFPNSSLQTEQTLVDTKNQKQPGDKWSRFANFFPFLRSVPKAQKNMTSNISIHQGRASQKPNIRLATAR